MPNEKNILSDKAALDILSVLKDGDQFGFGIIQAFVQRGNDTFSRNEGALYPVLHILEQNHYVKSYKKAAPSGRIRKHYKLTRSGARYLEKKLRETGQDSAGGRA